MNDQQGIDGFAEELQGRAVGVLGGGEDGESGPGSYDPLVAELRALSGTPALNEPLRAAWAGRHFTSRIERPLLVLAALRAAALSTSEGHVLGPELLLDAVAPDIKGRLVEALADPALIPWLASGELRYVDPARAFLWGLPALILGLGHRGFDIVERRATAGLGLVVDRTAIPFRFGTQIVQGFDFPAPERRLGFDARPLEVAGPDADRTVQWLTACIWPSETDRLARLKATLTHRRNPWRGDSPAPSINGADQLEWHACLNTVEPTGRPMFLVDATLPFEASPTLPPVAGDGSPTERLQGHPQTLWVYLVRTKHGGARALRIEAVLWRTGAWQRLTLGEVGFHGASVTMDLGGPSRLRALWQQPA